MAARKVAKFESDLLKTNKVAKFYRRLYGVCVGGINIQTSVNFPNFADLYLRSFKTYHFQTWQV